ncbi:MAG: protein kinase [Butyrivibrio sp.]|nr:protein kinase [Butyrivibrio sp.]
MENGYIFKGKYRILRKLGEGGSSRVYMAQDVKSGQPVTIKQMRRSAYGGQAEPAESGRGAREITVSRPDGPDGRNDERGGSSGVSASLGGAYWEMDMLLNLDHPAIPKAIAAYDNAVVMEYIPGNSAAKHLEMKGFFPEKEGVRISLEVLDILEYLHSLDKPVIYRDLKPANIMIKPDGHVALIDFGAARFYEIGGTADTQNLGTKAFAAPEQYGSLGQTDPRTDIYCFGRMLLQLVGGRCSNELMQIIEMCTRPDRDDRFTSCAEIRKELLKYPGRAFFGRMRVFMQLGAAAAVVAFALSFIATHYDAALAYAYSDAKVRVPAVRERLGNAGTRIGVFIEDKEDIKAFTQKLEEEARRRGLPVRGSIIGNGVIGESGAEGETAEPEAGAKSDDAVSGAGVEGSMEDFETGAEDTAAEHGTAEEDGADPARGSQE